MKMLEKPILEIKNLDKSFGENHVLSNFNLSLNKGQSIAVLGKSGSGKSVLIKCVIGLMPPDKGSIHVFDLNVPDLNEEQLDKIRVRIGFLFQSNALYDSMTVRENLEFPLRRHWLETSKQSVDDLVMLGYRNCLNCPLRSTGAACFAHATTQPAILVRMPSLKNKKYLQYYLTSKM